MINVVFSLKKFTNNITIRVNPKDSIIVCLVFVPKIKRKHSIDKTTGNDRANNLVKSIINTAKVSILPIESITNE